MAYLRCRVGAVRPPSRTLDPVREYRRLRADACEGLERDGGRSASKALAGMPIARVRDYQQNTVTTPGGPAQPLEGPTGDLVMLDLEPAGNYVAVRPRGPQPQANFYMSAY